MRANEYLVWELRRLRERHGLTQEAWGERVHYSHQHVSAIERGERPIRSDYLRAVDKAFGTSYAKLWEVLHAALAPTWFRPLPEIERTATAIRRYEPSLIPGLLQTEEYARMVLGCGLLTPEQAETHLTTRGGAAGGGLRAGRTAAAHARLRRDRAAARGRGCPA